MYESQCIAKGEVMLINKFNHVLCIGQNVKGACAHVFPLYGTHMQTNHN